MKGQINFINQEDFNLNLNQDLKLWIAQVIKSFGYNYSEINFTFYTDDELLELNKSYLQHDFYTDIITFDNTLHKTISTDIAISIDRVKDNAEKQNIIFKNELYRIMIHGILHCIGFTDDTTETKEHMRKEEDKALQMFHVEHKTQTTDV